MIERVKHLLLFGTRMAKYSDCERYRYSLRIVWNPQLPVMVFIGLNPSTATEEQDDPTITRCIGFAKREGCGGILMLNLFAFRATDPKVMKAEKDPIGHDNWLDDLMEGCEGPKVACWGTHGAHMERGAFILQCLPDLLCFGRNRDGSPKHPLYLRADTKLEPIRMGRRPV